MPSPKKIVLAYSGGLDTSVILPWLKERYPGVRLVAFAAELGQGSELKGIERKAKKSGADEVVVRDLRREFAEDYCFPMLRAHASYESDYLLGTSIARPLIAKAQVDVAHETGADAVAHGATGKGNDQVRFELTCMALDPSLSIISPWKDPRFLADGLNDRETAVDYAGRHTFRSRRRRRSSTRRIATCGTSRTRAARSRIPHRSLSSASTRSADPSARRPTRRNTSRSSSRVATRWP